MLPHSTAFDTPPTASSWTARAIAHPDPLRIHDPAVLVKVPALKHKTRELRTPAQYSHQAHHSVQGRSGLVFVDCPNIPGMSACAILALLYARRRSCLLIWRCLPYSCTNRPAVHRSAAGCYKRQNRTNLASLVPTLLIASSLYSFLRRYMVSRNMQSGR